MQRSETKAPVAGGAWIPERLATDILHKLSDLPSIVRFQSVSKSWCRLLSDPKFIHRALWRDDTISTAEERKEEIHQTQMILINENCRHLYFRTAYSFTLLSHHYHDDHDTVSLRPMSINPSNVLHGLQFRDLPVETTDQFDDDEYRGCYVTGCCDGMFCILNERTNSRAVELTLWNPATSETKMLPPSTCRCRGDTEPCSQRVGFGFDSKTQEYKVVRTFIDDAFGVSDSDLLNRTEVYSLRNDSWTKHEHAEDGSSSHERGIRYYIAPLEPLVVEFRRERVYWYDSQGIDSFNMRTGAFYYHEFPASLQDDLLGHTDQVQLVATPKESTMVAVFGDYQGVYRIWGLLKFHSPSSWTKLFTVSRFSVPIRFQRSALGALGRDGKYLFLKEGGELFAYDPETEEIVDLGIRAGSRYSYEEGQQQSLICSFLPSQAPISPACFKVDK